MWEFRNERTRCGVAASKMKVRWDWSWKENERSTGERLSQGSCIRDTRLGVCREPSNRVTAEQRNQGARERPNERRTVLCIPIQRSKNSKLQSNELCQRLGIKWGGLYSPPGLRSGQPLVVQWTKYVQWSSSGQFFYVFSIQFCWDLPLYGHWLSSGRPLVVAQWPLLSTGQLSTGIPVDNQCLASGWPVVCTYSDKHDWQNVIDRMTCLCNYCLIWKKYNIIWSRKQISIRIQWW